MKSIDLKNILNFLTRNIIWIFLGILALVILRPTISEIKTILLIITIEALALALSGIASFVYTKIDFTHDSANNNLGFIFLGVHLCVGLVVLGVYIAQFGN